MELIYIAYSSDDSNYARELYKSLLNYGVRVWMSEIDLKPGDRWAETILDTLRDASALIMIISPSFLRSDWFLRYYQRALASDKPIFPIVIEGDLPDSLRTIQAVYCKNGQLPPANFYETLSITVGLKRDSKEAEATQTSEQSTGQVDQTLSMVLEVIRGVIEPIKNQLETQLESVDKLSHRFDEILISMQEQKTGKPVMRRTEYVTAFMAMPFKEYDPLYLALQEVLEDLPYAWEVINASERYGEPTIDKNIRWHMEQAHCFLVEITDGNPNVFYELGLMHGSFEDRPVVLLRREDAPKKFADLEGAIYIQYPPFDNTRPDISAIKVALAKQLPLHSNLLRLRSGTTKHFLSSLVLSKIYYPKIVEKVCEVYKTAEEFVGASVDDVVERSYLQGLDGSVHDFQNLVRKFYQLE